MGDLPNNATEKCIIHLWGTDYKQLAPDASIKMGVQTSYGINGLVDERNWRPDQYLVMDANELVVNVNSANKDDFLDKVLAPRHYDKINVAYCDGSVHVKSLLEMEIEAEQAKNDWRGQADSAVDRDHDADSRFPSRRVQKDLDHCRGDSAPAALIS